MADQTATSADPVGAGERRLAPAILRLLGAPGSWVGFFGSLVVALAASGSA